MDQNQRVVDRQTDIDLNWAWLPFAAAMLPDFPKLYWTPTLYDSPSSSIRRAYARLAKNRAVENMSKMHGDPRISSPTLLNSSRINIFTDVDIPGPSNESAASGAKFESSREEHSVFLPSPDNSCSVPTESFLFSPDYENLKNKYVTRVNITAASETFETVDLGENDASDLKISRHTDLSVSKRSNTLEGSSIPDESSIYGANYSLSFISRSSSAVRRRRILVAIIVTLIAAAVAVIILAAWLVR